MKILVIGDSCIDTFRYGKVKRIAPEAPVPIIVPFKEESNPGMAGNVVSNLKALNTEVNFITNLDSIKKIRYVCSRYNQLVLRVDENDSCNRITKNRLTNLNWDDYNAIIISDYCKGFLNKEDIRYISQKHSLTFLDTKKELGEWAHNISYIKINNNEYENNLSILNNDSILLNKTIITKGPYGCEYQNKIYPTKEVPVKDVSGAGDTFLAGLVSEYVKTKNIKKAIDFAQKCTTIVVQKPGVSTI
jgi:D-glycero-beta-D-manno-heptose-7-phosphate kinase